MFPKLMSLEPRRLLFLAASGVPPLPCPDQPITLAFYVDGLGDLPDHRSDILWSCRATIKVKIRIAAPELFLKIVSLHH